MILLSLLFSCYFLFYFLQFNYCCMVTFLKNNLFRKSWLILYLLFVSSCFYQVTFKKYKTLAVFSQPDANTRGSLGELESLCEPEPQTRVYTKTIEFSQTPSRLDERTCIGQFHHTSLMQNQLQTNQSVLYAFQGLPKKLASFVEFDFLSSLSFGGWSFRWDLFASRSFVSEKKAFGFSGRVMAEREKQSLKSFHNCRCVMDKLKYYQDREKMQRFCVFFLLCCSS